MSRYRSFSRHLKERFPFRVRKIPVDAGFTCPNRDGVKGSGGCTYCDNRSFSPATRGPALPVERQIEEGMARYRRREGVDRFILYFQAYTNTYAPLSTLRQTYDIVRRFPEVVGLSIGTRPDCLSEATLDLIAEHARERAVWVEIGLESSHDRTLAAINRQHTYAEFVDAVRRTHARRLEVVAHTIFGLPGETREEMLTTADRISALPISHVKLHHLYIVPGTVMAEQYARGEIRVMTLDEWVALACDVLERLPPSMSVQRLVGELSGAYVVAPLWGVSKPQVHRTVEAELERRGTRQGSLQKSEAGGEKPEQSFFLTGRG
jgi:radical SAM protein (TIGR01212 family)